MTDLTKKTATEIVLNQSNPRGFEDPIDNSDLIIPRAQKLEAMSEELQDEGLKLKAGQIINSVTKQVLPEEFIPIFYFKTWIKFDKSNRKLIYRITDPNDERLKTDAVWNGDNPPSATAFMNFFSYFPGVTMPIIVSFCNTSYKTGKQLLSLARFGGGDMFSRKYKLTTKKTQNDKGTFYVLDVKLSKNVSDEELAFCENLYHTFRGKDIQIHNEEEQDIDKAPF